MDWWNRKFFFKRRELRELDLTDFVQFLEEETLLIKDSQF